MVEAEQATLSIPSLLAFAILSIIALRYFLSGSSSSSSAASSTYPSAARRIPYDRIDTVASMFPQLARRDIEWDLRRNGGSVQATTERVLREGRLDNAPPSFRAQTPPATSTSTSNTSGPGAQPRRTPQSEQHKHDDLITRYKLSGKVEGAEAPEETIQSNRGGWSSSKAERAALLQRRRDEMVLAARRKMEERDRKGKGVAGN